MERETGSGCTIKGNISAGGDRIYHLPGSRDYERTRINDRAGGRMFCSEGDGMAGYGRRYATLRREAPLGERRRGWVEITDRSGAATGR